MTQVIKTLKHVKDHQVIIDLPSDFSAQEVEVIIIAKQPQISHGEQKTWQEDFRTISQWDIDEEEIKIASWQIVEF